MRFKSMTLKKAQSESTPKIEKNREYDFQKNEEHLQREKMVLYYDHIRSFTR